MNIKENSKQHAVAIDILNDLHANGFTRLWIQSQMVNGGGRMRVEHGDNITPEYQQFFLKVIIDSEDLDDEKMSTIRQIADDHGARMILDELRFNQQNFSRVCIWPVTE